MWLPEDTELALAWQAEQDLTCPGCGNPRDECMDPANADAYEVHVLRCFACEAKSLSSSRSESVESHGLYYVAEREVTGRG